MTKEITLKIGDLFKAIEKYKNFKFEIEKEVLFDFDIKIQNEYNQYIPITGGIIKKDNGLKIYFDNKKTISCAANHKICLTKDNVIFAKNLRIGDVLIDTNGFKNTVTKIENTNETTFYDLCVKNKTHLYKTSNNIIHHNTFLSKSLAKNLFGDEKALIRFDMSEYMEKHAVAKLIGAPPGYEGFECGGILTNTVRKNPIGVYLFDEIEKAHPDVFNIFLQILSDGRLTDNIGRTVDFSEAIIVMTSNIGQKYYLDTNLTEEESQEKANEELCKTYRSELLNRFNGRENIFHFKRLSMETIQKIVKREITNLSKAYEEDMCIQMSDSEIEEFCKDQYDPIKGARGLPGFIKAHLRPKLVDEMLHNNSERPAFWIRYNKETKDFYFDYIVTLDDVCGEIG